MSKIEVNAIEPQCGTDLTVGASGDTITFPTGTTVVNNGSQTGFGRTGTVDWDTTPKTSTVTAANGVGYFVDTTSGSVTVNLPVGSAGAIVAIADYANTADTNKIVIAANGTEKIQGVASNPFEIAVEGGSVTLVYVDSTQGWRPTDASTAAAITENNVFITATGGTITCCGDYKIHTFTGPGTFCVSAGGGPVAVVDYLVVAGGGSGGTNLGGGGGAGGFRESVPSPAAWSASPLAAPGGALPVSIQGYAITVGAGAVGSPYGSLSIPGSNSVFSTIISTGGGGGGTASVNGGTGEGSGRTGGSGGGSSYNLGGVNPGAGNTPPVSPPQGNKGGNAVEGPPAWSSGGGGGANAQGTNSDPSGGGNGGTGATTSISASPTAYAGGGGGAGSVNNGSPGGAGGTGGGGVGAAGPASPIGSAGTTNTGGGGGGVSNYPAPSGNQIAGHNGGSGIVIIRYKFQ